MEKLFREKKNKSSFKNPRKRLSDIFRIKDPTIYADNDYLGAEDIDLDKVLSETKRISGLNINKGKQDCCFMVNVCEC